MTTELTEQSNTQVVHQEIQATAREMEMNSTDKLDKFEKMIRKNPTKSILYATAAGYGVHLLPVGSILRLPLRLAVSLAKPALLGLGAAKLYDIVQERTGR